MRKALVFAVVLLLAPVMAQAQIHQVSSSASEGSSTIQFDLGYFALRGLESRPDNDVLVGDLISAQPLLFEIKDFNGFHFGGEYLFGAGHIEGGVGLGYTQETVPTVYANLTHSNGSEIEQDLKLRTIPVTFTARFLPLRRGSVVEPYIGAGLVAIRWDYSEVGEFVDAVDDSIFPRASPRTGPRSDRPCWPDCARRSRTGRSAEKCAGRKLKGTSRPKPDSSGPRSISAAGSPTSPWESDSEIP